MIDAHAESPSDPPRRPTVSSWRHRRASGVIACAVASVLAIGASFATGAFASGGTITVGSASNSEVGKRIVVNAQGRTLYALSPETTTHLLCASAKCLKVWPPLTVPSRKTKLKAGPGVRGHLAILRRSDGRLQVTLRGRPLYRFSGDTAKGEASGEGLESFGGTWHAVTAASSPGSPAPASTTPAPAAPETSTTPTTPGYGY
jgi:predicted lipoprotein with Yx(FWY)xxD motif